MAVLTALAVSNPKPIREVRPTVPEDLSDLVMQLLEKDPADRPATAEAVVARLQKNEGRLNARPTVRSPSAALADVPAPSPASGSATHVDWPARPKTPTPKRPTRARKTRPARRRRTIQFLALGLAAAGLAVALAVGLALHFASAPGGSAAGAASPAFLSDLPLIEDHNPIKAPPLPPGLPEPPPFTGVRVHNRPASHGIFMHPPMQPEGGTAGLSYKLGGMYARFGAEASLNDGPPESMTPLTFTVRGDGRILWQSHPIRRQDDAERREISVRGVDVVTIEVNCPGDPRVPTPSGSSRKWRRECGRVLSGRFQLSRSPCYHRITAVPQASPAPKPLSTARRPGLNAPLRHRLVQRQRHRAGRGVAVAVEVVEDLAARDVQHVDGGVDDADVGLMRDVQIDVLRLQAGGVEHVLNGVAQDGDGPAEDGPAVHVHVVHALGQQFRRRRQAAAAGRPAQQVAAAAVRPEAEAEHALVRPAARQQHRARRRRRTAGRS